MRFLSSAQTSEDRTRTGSRDNEEHTGQDRESGNKIARGAAVRNPRRGWGWLINIQLAVVSVGHLAASLGVGKLA